MHEPKVIKEEVVTKEEKERYVCPLCDKIFPRKRNFEIHYEKIHGKDGNKDSSGTKIPPPVNSQVETALDVPELLEDRGINNDQNSKDSIVQESEEDLKDSGEVQKTSYSPESIKEPEKEEIEVEQEEKNPKKAYKKQERKYKDSEDEYLDPLEEFLQW